MTTWILIIMLYSQGSVIHSVEFNSKDKCVSALEQIKSNSNLYLKGVCVEK